MIIIIIIIISIIHVFIFVNDHCLLTLKTQDPLLFDFEPLHFSFWWHDCTAHPSKYEKNPW